MKKYIPLLADQREGDAACQSDRRWNTGMAANIAETLMARNFSGQGKWTARRSAVKNVMPSLFAAADGRPVFIRRPIADTQTAPQMTPEILLTAK